jgi:hypothetical protein
VTDKQDGLPCVYCGLVKTDAIMMVSPHTDAIICHECVLQLSQTLVEITRTAKKSESLH